MSKWVKNPVILDRLYIDIRCKIAQNSETLDYLSKDKRCWIRRGGCVKNPNTSSETLKQMSIDEENYWLKYHIKNHPNCPLETYKYLSALEILETLPKVST